MKTVKVFTVKEDLAEVGDRVEVIQRLIESKMLAFKDLVKLGGDEYGD